MLRNPALETVLSLDPYFPRYALDHYRHGSKVRALPDPAQRLIEPTRAETDLAAIAIPEDRVGFFLFGELTARKGVMALLDALPRLPAESAGKAAIVIAGRLDPALRDTVHRTVRDLHETHPELRLWLVDRPLGRGEIVATARRCSVILAPYQRFVGSSGVLIWAAALRRPVISQNYGLLGRLIRENGLGLTVDTGDPYALADAIAATIRDGTDTLGRTDGMAIFAAARSHEVFASGILHCSAPAPKSASRNGPNGIRNVDTDWSQDSTAYSQPRPERT
jgi:glycosyltransferase involved in cell wall biosynthesis